MAPGSYRESHCGPGRGDIYDARYEQPLAREFWERAERPVVARLLGEVSAHGVDRALDFACGTGRITTLLEGHFRAVTAVDISPSMLTVARGKCARTTFVEGDLLADSTLVPRFPLITAFRFFANAEPALRERALDALVAHLEPGGWLLLNNHQNDRSVLGRARKLRPGAKKDFLDPSVLPRMLAARDCRIVRSVGIGFLPHWRGFGGLPASWRGNLERWLAGEGTRVAWAEDIVHLARGPE
jgi:SAM-dependent methyltransferase